MPLARFKHFKNAKVTEILFACLEKKKKRSLFVFVSKYGKSFETHSRACYFLPLAIVQETQGTGKIKLMREFYWNVKQSWIASDLTLPSRLSLVSVANNDLNFFTQPCRCLILNFRTVCAPHLVSALHTICFYCVLCEK